MKYRTKLCLGLVGAACISCALALAIVYEKTKKGLFNELRSEVTTIATTTSLLVDGDLLKTVLDQQNQSSAQYSAFQHQLRKARDANQRENIFIKYVYTIAPSPNDSQLLVFGVDADSDPEPMSEPFTYADAGEILAHLEEPYADTRYIRDPWGYWLSGYAPIYDSAGNYVATLGADLNAKRANVVLDQLIIFGLTALGASLLIALTLGITVSRMATRPLNELCEAVEEIGKGNIDRPVFLKTNDEFQDLATAINAMEEGLKERERLKMNFARYVSQYVLEKILSSEAMMKLEGEKKKVTVLFADIRQFTHIAESLEPEKVIGILNEYFERMLEVIFRNHGTLDKFIGDGLMVEFGAPLDDPLQEQHALDAALQMQEELKLICAEWQKVGKPQIQIGIGVHTGNAVIGTIGSEKRMEFTAIGDTVRVASQLEQATKVLKVPILVSSVTMQAVKDQYNWESLGAFALPDKKEKMEVFSLISSKDAHPV
jgi:adenylate cyclase